MAKFEVELDGKVVKIYEAERFERDANTFDFYDSLGCVGSIVRKSGMTVSRIFPYDS